MIPIPPFAIKYGIYAIIALLIVGAYFAWKHHVQVVEKERVMRDVAEKSVKLLQKETIKVQKENAEMHTRKDNAIQAYAEHSSNIQRDVDNLARRLRNTSAGSCKDSVRGTIIDATSRERPDQITDARIAETVINLVNSCEFWIDQIPVSE